MENILNASLPYPHLCIKEQITETKIGLRSTIFAYYKFGIIAIERISDFLSIDKLLEAFAVIENPSVNGRKYTCFTL